MASPWVSWTYTAERTMPMEAAATTTAGRTTVCFVRKGDRQQKEQANENRPTVVPRKQERRKER